jgi:hypothetical protein
MFTLNMSRHAQTPEEIVDLRNFINSADRFGVDQIHSDLMRRTAPQAHAPSAAGHRKRIRITCPCRQMPCDNIRANSRITRALRIACRSDFEPHLNQVRAGIEIEGDGLKTILDDRERGLGALFRNCGSIQEERSNDIPLKQMKLYPYRSEKSASEQFTCPFHATFPLFLVYSKWLSFL